jgi:hypothetical protein
MEDSGSSDVLSTLLTIAAILAIVLATSGAVAFWFFMMRDLLRNNSLNHKRKILWGIGIVGMPPVAIAYFFIAHTRNNQNYQG